MTLPAEECAFFYAAQAQLAPELRPIFIERVANTLGAFSPFCEPGPGDVDRAIRQALVGLWTPPPVEEVKNASRLESFDARVRTNVEAGLLRRTARHGDGVNMRGTVCYHFATQFGSTERDQVGRGGT